MSEPLLLKVSIFNIRANPNQPRKEFKQAELEELAASLRSRGQQQPIKVRKIADEAVSYEIIMGERRWRSFHLNHDRGHAGFDTIAALVTEESDKDMDIDAIVENLQRVDVNPVDEAIAFDRLVSLHNMSDEEIGRQVGIAPHRVRERLALVKLDDQVQVLVRQGQLPPTSGVEIARLPKQLQTSIVRRIAKGGLKTIAEIRAAVETLLQIEAEPGMALGDKPASVEDLKVVTAMEKKIETVGLMVSTGWKDSECVVARKVAPDRARDMADRLDAIRLSCDRMARDLRQAAVQKELTS